MDSIALFFKASKDLGKEGTLLYRIVYNGKTRQIDTGFRIYPEEWSEEKKLLFFQVMTIGTTAISFLSEMIWNY